MQRVQLALVLAATSLLAGCEAIAGIFKAGVWTGVILVVAVIAIVIYAVTKSK